MSLPLGFLCYFFQTCQSCFKTIPKGDVVVLAEFDENEVSCYHAACFCCSTCWELLVDLTYFRFGNKVYCGRHHAELSRQRCFGCDEVRLFTALEDGYSVIFRVRVTGALTT